MPYSDKSAPLEATAMPLIVAHRGCSAIAPENTLAAFRLAIEAGVPAAECDARCTRDNHVALLHDETLDRTTDGAGPLSDLSLAELRSLDAGSWKAEQFRGERVPTLEETLALTKGKLRLIVEIKAAGIEPRVVEVIRDADALADVTIVSFSLETCRQIREIEPRLPVGWLTIGLEADDEGLADELIHTALSANVQFISVAVSGVNAALLRRADLAGLCVWTWTVDDPSEVERLARLGLRSITSNDPAMALEVVGRLALTTQDLP